MAKVTEQLIKIDEKLESLLSVIPLLKILAKAEIDKVKDDILTTTTRKEIFELCDGKKDIQEIAKEVNTTQRYVNILVSELEESGLLTINKKGAKRYPKKTI